MTSNVSRFAILSIAIASLDFAAGVARADEFDVTVRRQEAVSTIADDTAAKVLETVSEIFEGASGGDDEACAVTLVLRGSVGTLTAAELPFFISSQADFDRVRSLPGTVKIVGDIGWCGGIGAGIAGCANKPGPALVMTWKSSRVRNAVVLAHEYLHTAGNPHRSGTRALMLPTVGLDNDRVNGLECDKAMGGPSAVSESGEAIPNEELDYSGLHGADEDLAQNDEQTDPSPITEEPEAPSDPQAVLAFVSQVYAHGVPFAEASEFSPEDVPVLEQVIELKGASSAGEPNFEVVGNAVATLGAIATEEATEALREYLLSDPSAEISVEETVAKADTLIALGWAVNQTGNNELLSLLLDGSSSDWWAEVAGVDWKTPAFATREDLIEYLVAKAILGLTLSGAHEARLRLEQIRSEVVPGSPQAVISDNESLGLQSRFGDQGVDKVMIVAPGTVEAVQNQGGETYIDAIIGELETIQTDGLVGYYQ